MAQIGEVLDDKYIILYEVGRGGMSTVYQARDKRLNKNWAVKEIRKQGLDPRMNLVAGNSAITEAEMIKSLDNYYIPHINDILETDEHLYVIMDYIEGEALEDILKADGPQPEKQVIKWGKQLCEALHYLHTQNPSIIYRDMKPANVMIKPDGDIKLIDFGIARTYKAENTADTTILGTAGYAPREQYGWGQTDARSDVYSLGATMFHAVTGYGPGDGDQFLNVPIRHFNANLSGGLENIILKCTQANPNDRYQNCDELMYALEHYQEADDAFFARQRSRLRRFVVMALFALICAGVGALGLRMSAQTNNQDYGQLLVLAENASDSMEKIGYYAQMINIKPTERTPWYGIVDTCKSDTIFDLDEEKALIDVLTKYLTELRMQPYYSEIAFEVGKLYWYYYSYGQTGGGDTSGEIAGAYGTEEASNRSTQMKSSVRWFLDTMEYGGRQDSNFEIAQIYSDIGVFAETINTSVAEASDTGKYKPFFENLSELEAMLSADTAQPEIVSLTVDMVILDSIETYARKFRSDGVSEADVRALIERAQANAQGVDATTDKTQAMKTRILNEKTGAAMGAADRAYKEDERGLVY